MGRLSIGRGSRLSVADERASLRLRARSDRAGSALGRRGRRGRSWPARRPGRRGGGHPRSRQTCRKGSTIRRRFAKRRRDALRPVILAKAISVSIVFASAEEIDPYNIRGAALRAMARAVRALSVRPHLALIDGRDIPDGLGCPARAIDRRRRALDVDRRRFDRRQDDARRAHAQSLAGLSAIRLCRPCRLCDGVSPASARGRRSLPLSPALVPAGVGL